MCGSGQSKVTRRVPNNVAPVPEDLNMQQAPVKQPQQLQKPEIKKIQIQEDDPRLKKPTHEELERMMRPQIDPKYPTPKAPAHIMEEIKREQQRKELEKKGPKINVPKLELDMGLKKIQETRDEGPDYSNQDLGKAGNN